MTEVLYRPVGADLTEDEIASITYPLTQGHARIKFLRSLGLHVDRRPDGQPLVNRAHYDEVRSGKKQLEAAGADNGIRWGVH